MSMIYARTLMAIVLLRVLSALIEVSAALFVWKSRDLRLAMQVNALLGLVGPAIFVSASLLGLRALSSELSTGKVVVVLAGVLLVLVGTR